MKFIGFAFNVFDECGIYDVLVPSASYQDNDKTVKDKDNEWDDIFGLFGGKSTPQTISGVIVNDQTMDKFIKSCIINGKIASSQSDINELTLKYKIKGEAEDSQCLFDNTSNTFCHVISNILSDFTMKKPMDNIKQLYPTPFGEGHGDKGMYGESNEPDIIVPRRVIFVIDKSGSMSGGKWRRTVSATINGLKQLRTGYDRFNVILFDNYNHKLYDYAMESANQQSIEQAIKYMESMSAGGGTDIDAPLKEAINMIKTSIP